MKKFFFYFAAFAALVSCAKEGPVDKTSNTKEFSFLAYAPGTEVPEAKSILGEDGVSVLWENDDNIKVFVRANGSSSTDHDFASTFTTTLSEASGQAYFKGDLSNAYDGKHQPYAHAVYPSTANISYDASAYKTSGSYDLQSEQVAGLGGSFGKYNLSSASLYFDYNQANETSNALFLNGCAIIKITAPADLNYIEVSSNDSTPLAGGADIEFKTVPFNGIDLNNPASSFDNFSYRPAPVNFTDGSASVTLTNGDQPLQEGIVYNIVVWPGKHSQGLTIEMEDTSGKKFKKTSSNAITFEASKYKTFTFSNVEFVEPLKPAVGLYVNTDGSFSNEYISGTSVGKIFYLGDPTSDDTELKAKYPNCTRGLAYKVGTDGAVQWNEGYMFAGSISDIITYNTSSYYTNTSAFRGYSCSLAIKESFNPGILTNVDLESSAAKNTSPWYMASKAEIDVAKDNGVSLGYTPVWVSTVYLGGTNYIYPYNYNTNLTIDYKGTTTSRKCLLIFAF